MQSGLGGPEMLFIGTESVREGGKPTEDIDVTFREVLDRQFNTDATNLVYVLRSYNIKDAKRNGKNVVIEGVKYDTTNPSAMQSLKTSIINSASKATKENAIKGAIYSPSQTGNIDYSRK